MHGRYRRKFLPDGTVDPRWHPHKSGKSGKRKNPRPLKQLMIAPEIEHLVVFPFPCPNCDRTVEGCDVYCSSLCQEEAEYVRYHRRCIADGRDELPDVQLVLRIRRAFLVSGGYNKEERRIPPHIRDQVVARDGGRCRTCGKPAFEIDHVNGPSSELDNLQLLCDECHNTKTIANLVPITPETNPEQCARLDVIMARVCADEPVLDCDSDSWDLLWRKVRGGRQRVMALRGQTAK